MNINEIIKYPILTEKTYNQMKDSVYTFAVDRRTNRSEVKKAVEFIFDVKVEKVNIFNVPKKAKNLGRFHGFTNAYKRAIVKLVDGQTINVFEDEVQEVQEEVKKSKKTKEDDKVMSEAEAKAAAKIAKKANK